MIFPIPDMIFVAYHYPKSTYGCLIYFIIGVGLVIWSFIGAYKMTVEEKRMKEKEAEWQGIQDNTGIPTEWGKVKIKTKQKRRRRHIDQDTGEYYQAPF